MAYAINFLFFIYFHLFLFDLCKALACLPVICVFSSIASSHSVLILNSKSIFKTNKLFCHFSFPSTTRRTFFFFFLYVCMHGSKKSHTFQINRTGNNTSSHLHTYRRLRCAPYGGLVVVILVGYQRCSVLLM